MLALPQLQSLSPIFFHDKPLGMDAERLVFSITDPICSDHAVGHEHDLTRIGRIGNDLLIAGERSVEHHLAEYLPFAGEAFTLGAITIFQHEQGLHDASIIAC
jgi:hypothetical protein